MSSLPRLTAPSRNWTPATPTSSEAEALTETVLLTVAPEAGEVTETLGGWSAGTTAVACAERTADVAGRVLCRHPVVVGAGCEPRVGVARAGRLGDPVPGGRREARRLRAVHVVADDPHVVARRRPAERRRPDRSRRRQARRSRRRSRVGRRRRAADSRLHVLLHLGRAQRPVVDAHLVDQAREPLAPDAVATDAQHPRRGRHRARNGRRRRQRPVHVQPQQRPVIGRRQMRPGIQRQRRRPGRVPLRADEHLAQRPRAGLIARTARRRGRPGAP